MRILIWSETFYPHIGGVEVMGEAFVRGLHARGHEVVIVAGPYQHQEREPQSFHGIPIYRFPFEYAERPFSIEIVARIKQRLVALLQNFRPQVFHFYQSLHAFFLHTSKTRREPAPTLLTLHSRFFTDAPSVNQARIQLCQQVDWVTACSHFLLEETREMVPEITHKSSLIYNSLTMPADEPTPLDLEGPRILYVGRLHPNKGADIAIDAFGSVQRRFPHARLLVAGSGPEEANLRAQAEALGITSAVDFLGWVSPHAVPALLNQATIVLVPSRTEGFCLSALQAGQMARPVVATRVGGLPEVIVDGETGMLVEAENAEAMANALVSLLTQPDRAHALGTAARQHVQQKFGWSTFLEQYETLYARLIEEAKVRA